MSTDSNGHLLITDAGSELASLRGQNPGVTPFTKFGRNPLTNVVDSNEDVWAGSSSYTGFPTELETLSVLSDNPLDTSAGTGARTVTIYGLDGDYNEQSEVVILNGITPVATVGTYRRCARTVVETAGSGQSNTGAITVRHTTTTANVFVVIPALTGQSSVGCWTVPAGETFYMDKLLINVSRNNGSAGSAVIAFQTKSNTVVDSAWQSKRVFSVTTAAGRISDSLVKIPEKTDIRVRIISVSDLNTSTSVEFSGTLIDAVE